MSIKIQLNLIAFVVFIFPFAIHAETYSWIDEHGTVYFSDNPMSVPKNNHTKANSAINTKSILNSIKTSGASYDYPQISESFDYYDIAGMSESELRRQMDVNGNLWNDGKRYAGMTFWNVRWMTYPRMNKDLCSVDKIDAFVDVKFRMPRWSNNSTAPANVQNWWTWYYDGLLKHENGHRDLGVEAARELQRKIAEVQPHKTCKELYETANKVGNKVLEKYKQLERDYDARTKHGLDQEAAYR
jgi:predicted secreted Zn-dependent protease